MLFPEPVGPVTSSAADAIARRPGQIYLPYVITSGVPLLVWAAVLAVLAFGLIEVVRWLRTPQLRGEADYQDQAATFRDPLIEPRNHWYWSGLSPSGTSNGGSSVAPSCSVRSHMSATSSVLASASGRSANVVAISSGVFR